MLWRRLRRDQTPATRVRTKVRVGPARKRTSVLSNVWITHEVSSSSSWLNHCPGWGKGKYSSAAFTSPKLVIDSYEVNHSPNPLYLWSVFHPPLSNIIQYIPCCHFRRPALQPLDEQGGGKAFAEGKVEAYPSFRRLTKVLQRPVHVPVAEASAHDVKK